MNLKELKYNEQGLIPAIAQDADTKQVLMMAWMNRESLEITLETKRVTYWSRSRKKLWTKGESSGNFQTLQKAYYDCDGDTILLLVKQQGAACHTGSKSCFYREFVIKGEIDHA